MNTIEMLIDEIIVKLAEHGYRFRAEYTFSSDYGEVASVKLVFCGRLA